MGAKYGWGESGRAGGHGVGVRGMHFSMHWLQQLEGRECNEKQMMHPFPFWHWSSYTPKRDRGASRRLLATLAQESLPGPGLLAGFSASPAALAPRGADLARTEYKKWGRV